MDEEHYWLEAAAVKKLSISVLLGRDVPELVKIGPTVQGTKKSLVMVMTTRAEAKKWMEEEARTEQKEKQSGAKAFTPVVEQVDSDVAMDNRVQLRNSLDNAAVLHTAEGKPKHLYGEGEKLFNVEGIRRLQRDHPNLQPLWKVAKGECMKGNMWFYEESGMLYQHCQPHVEGEGLGIEQLVLLVVSWRIAMDIVGPLMSRGARSNQ